MAKIKLALLGRKIGYSQSPAIYKKILGEQLENYTLLDCNHSSQIPAIEEIFNQHDGLSITAPYKEHFLRDVVINDEGVRELNAINCIKKAGDKYEATNTDISAMRRLLPELAKNKVIVILGSGAMARVTTRVCKELGVKWQQFSRSINSTMFNDLKLDQIADGNVLVVNCCAREYTFNQALPEKAYFWDMNYAHADHMRLFGTNPQYRDGLNLLEGQAIDALKFWGLLKN